jgi:putative ABC transport system permease protein
MRTIYQQLANAYPADHVGRTLRLRTLRDAYLGWNWRPLFFFLGAAWFVLLLSCANVANLLLARAMTRQREFAIRGALGGGPGALFRLLFIEGALLAVLGAGTGLLLASWAIRILPHWMPPSYLDRGGNIELDTRVYFFSLLMAGVTAILFGLPPALFAARRQLSAMLAQGGRTATGSAAQRRTRHALVVMEVTTALVLLFGAGLFVNSFIRLTHLPLGFEPQGRLTMRVPVSGARYSDPGRIVGFVNQLIEHIAQVPGVRDAAVATSAPLGSGPSARFIVPDQPRPAAGDEPKAIVRAVSPGFFRTFDIRQLAGRDFVASDADGAPKVTVINERLAHRLFADRAPLGKELVIVDVSMSWVKPGVVQIVGVVADIKDVGLNEADFNDIYVPLAQNPVASLELVVNTSVPPSAVVDVLRQQVSGLDRDLPVYAISTMADRVDDAFRGDRFNVLLVGAFAVLAVIVAGVGIYGTMSYATEQRTREFGVRLALGARRGGILTLALGQSARLGAIGTGIGLAVSLVLARLLGSALYLVPGEHDGLIYGVGLTDPLTLTCAATAIVGLAALAGLGPACRATRIDPLVTLRCE